MLDIIFLIIYLIRFLIKLVSTEWFLFAAIALLVECYVLRKIARTRKGKKLSAWLKESFWISYVIFCVVFPLFSLGVLLALGAHPPVACGAMGAVMIVNGIFTGALVEPEIKWLDSSSDTNETD